MNVSVPPLLFRILPCSETKVNLEFENKSTYGEREVSVHLTPRISSQSIYLISKTQTSTVSLLAFQETLLHYISAVVWVGEHLPTIST